MHSVRRGEAVRNGRADAVGHACVPSLHALSDAIDVQHGRVSTTSPPATRFGGSMQRMTSGG